MNLTPCQTCDWYRRVSHAGADCDMHQRLERLSHNLSTAAALCQSFALGESHEYDVQARNVPQFWPGCGMGKEARVKPSGGTER